MISPVYPDCPEAGYYAALMNERPFFIVMMQPDTRMTPI